MKPSPRVVLVAALTLVSPHAVPIVLLLPNMEDEAVAEAGQQPGGGALVDDAVAAGAARGVGGVAANGVQALCWLPSHIAPSWKYACTTHRAVSEEDARVLEWCVGVCARPAAMAEITHTANPHHAATRRTSWWERRNQWIHSALTAKDASGLSTGACQPMAAASCFAPSMEAKTTLCR